MHVCPYNMLQVKESSHSIFFISSQFVGNGTQTFFNKVRKRGRDSTSETISTWVKSLKRIFISCFFQNTLCIQEMPYRHRINKKKRVFYLTLSFFKVYNVWINANHIYTKQCKLIFNDKLKLNVQKSKEKWNF